MTRTIGYFVKTTGITLPDGTVWGAETKEMYRTVSELGQPGFLVYEVFGQDLVNVFGDGNRVNWREMKRTLDERIAYQNSIGNKVYCGGDEITEI